MIARIPVVDADQLGKATSLEQCEQTVSRDFRYLALKRAHRVEACAEVRFNELIHRARRKRFAEPRAAFDVDEKPSDGTGPFPQDPVSFVYPSGASDIAYML